LYFFQTALDLTAPASDAILKNRKNTWIQLAGHPGMKCSYSEAQNSNNRVPVH